MTTLPPVDIERVVNEVQKIVDRAMEVDGGLGGVPVSVSYLRAMLYHLHERLRVVDVEKVNLAIDELIDAYDCHINSPAVDDSEVERCRQSLLSSFKALKLERDEAVRRAAEWDDAFKADVEAAIAAGLFRGDGGLHKEAGNSEAAIGSAGLEDVQPKEPVSREAPFYSTKTSNQSKP